MYDCFNPSDNTYGLYSKNHFVIKNINETIEQQKTEYLLKYHRREDLSNDHIIVNLIKAYCHNRGLFDYLPYSLINEHGCSIIPDHVSYTEEAAVKDYISQQAAMAYAQSLDNDYECYGQGISKKSSTCLQEIYTGYGFKGKLNDFWIAIL